MPFIQGASYGHGYEKLDGSRGARFLVQRESRRKPYNGVAYVLGKIYRSPIAINMSSMQDLEGLPSPAGSFGPSEMCMSWISPSST